METIFYTPKGVCSRNMSIDVDNGIIQAVRVEGGCEGNLQGLSILLQGMRVEDAISRMKNIKCGERNTSCPDQLSLALSNSLSNHASSATA